ncbi:energy-coupling factor transporter ATPase [Acetonema longum]|uniref:Cobalt ABC transporter ATPase n=1 Tax=Acetonema longum DSM 6540 TaxID=1009370 RepID=F7NF66_9FIRM|nr:energy-coupling factor transporter ATPase [Acetonema longum]EGO65321.1 cobalt ABC transporter ATPase [Acetonema longum DSM 6540]
MSSEETIIHLEHVTHLYTDQEGVEVKALDDVNLTVSRGEFLAVIGANGSGKSTLAKHLNALLLPTSGECRIFGRNAKDPDQLWNIRQSVGMVFQNPDNQIVAAIVEEDVAFGPENLAVPSDQIKERVDQALKAVGMESYRQHAPHLLSGGQKQRVAIAGVLAMRSQCLVLDEPTAMLDPKGRAEVLSTVRRLNREEGITVVYITHFMEEAMWADRVVVMEAGKVVDQGTPKAIFSQVERLKAMGLDVPTASDLSYRLRQRGVSLPVDIITEEELAVALCPSN